MAIKINSDGTWFAEYEGEYLGLDVQHPETLISDKASPSFNSFILRNAELRSCPRFIQAFPGPFGQWPLGITSFLDINGLYHIVYWAGNAMSQYNPNLGVGVNPWSGVGIAAPGNMQTNTVSYRAFANKIYYTSIGFIAGKPGVSPVTLPFMGYWDGLAAAPVFTQTFSDTSVSQSAAGISLTDSPTVGGSLPNSPTITGPIAIGGGYLGELNNQLILANVTIKDQGANQIYNFPNLMWWSANGLPLQWDPTQNISAGFNAFLDVSDQITGMMTLGIAGYLFRTYGITQFAPTGNAYTPFEFDHMWASEHGIGNVFPWSIAQYGQTGAFVAQDNIYSLSITNAERIGGVSRDAIFADLATGGTPFANILPLLVGGYIYLTYWLLIPFPSFLRAWVYSFDEKNWAPQNFAISTFSPFPTLTCAPNVV